MLKITRRGNADWLSTWAELLEPRRFLEGSPTVQFAAATLTGAEGIGQINLNLVLSAPSPIAVAVPYSVSGGTAGPEDFVLAAGPAVIPAGALGAAIELTITGDAIDEPDETIVVALGTPFNAVLGEPSTLTFTIVDDDPVPSVRFTTASASVGESTPTHVVGVQLSAPSSFEVEVPLSAISGTASHPADFTFTPATITIPAGQTNASTTISIVNDALPESNETAVLTMSTPLNAVLGTPSQFTLTINDDDAPVPPVVVSSQFLYLGGPQRIQIQFNTNVSASLSGADLQVQNHSTLTRISTTTNIAYDFSTNTATFSFPGLSNGVLPDGNYRVRLLFAGVTNVIGESLTTDAVIDFFTFGGDANHDRTVDITDFSALAGNFNSAGDFAQGDFNYDGIVNISDFSVLASRFNQTVAPLAPPTIQYTRTQLPTPFPTNSAYGSTAMNDGGQVVGYATSSAGGHFNSVAFSWRPGDAALTFGGGSRAADISNSGSIVGWANTGPTDAVQWMHGASPTYLGDLPGTFDGGDRALGVNNLNNVVGSDDNPTPTAPYVPKGIKWLTGAGSAQPVGGRLLTAINDNADIVGDGPTYYPSGSSSGTTIGSGGGLAMKVNNFRQVVGVLGTWGISSTLSTQMFTTNGKPFLWRPGMAEPFMLEVPANGTNYRASGINNLGQIVGGGDGPSVIWHQGMPYPLSNFVVGSGNTPDEGMDINNNGQILTQNLMVLTPVPAGFASPTPKPTAQAMVAKSNATATFSDRIIDQLELYSSAAQ